MIGLVMGFPARCCFHRFQ